MLTQILWWTGNALTGLLLIRSVLGGLLTRYPYFYFYQVFFLVRSLVSFYLYLADRTAFQRFYWHTEFVGVAVEYAIIWEIYAQALRDYAGAARMGRRLLSLVFVAVVAKVLANTLSGPLWSPAETTAELEAYLRSVEAMLLAAIVALFIYYGIPVGRNLRMLLLGYGFLVSTRIFSLVFRIYGGDEVQSAWQYMHQMAYCLTLAIWNIGLWSYVPQVRAEKDTGLERDYQLISARMQSTITLAREYFMRAMRP